MTDPTHGAHHQGDDDAPLDLSALMSPDELNRLAAEARAQVLGTPAGRADATAGTIPLPIPLARDEGGFVVEQHTTDRPARTRPTAREWVPELLISPAARAARRAELEHAAAHHSRHVHVYVARLGRALWYGARYGGTNVWDHFTAADSYRDDIAKAKAAKARKIGEASGNDWVRALKAEQRVEGKARRRETLPLLGVAAGTSYVAALLAVAQVWGLVMAGAVLLPGIAALMGYGHREHGRRHPDMTPLVHFAPAHAAQDAPLTDDALNRALRVAGLMTDEESLALVGRIVSTDIDASEGIFDLPDGLVYSEVKAKLEKIAGALRIDAEWLDIRQQGHPGRISVWMTRSDPYEAHRTSPLVGHTGPLNTWRVGVPVAYDKRGTVLYLPLTNVAYLIGGATRAGKGIAVRNILCGASLDPRVRIRIATGRKPAEHSHFSRVAATFFGGNSGPLRARLDHLLDALDAEINRRERLLTERGKSELDEDDLAEFPIELVIVDEAKFYTDADTMGKEAEQRAARMANIAAIGAALGILLVVAVQDPKVAIIPGPLAANLRGRWSMRVDGEKAAAAILGSGAAGKGMRPQDLPHDSPGLGVMDMPGNARIKSRAYMIDQKGAAHEVTDIVDEAVILRDEAGVLPGQFADAVEEYLLKVTGETSRGGGPKGIGLPGLPAEFAGALREGILGALLDAFEAAEVDELGSADIARLLHKLDPSADWGQREGETDRAWSSRVGARLGQEIKAACKEVGRPPVEAAKVTTLDGKEGRGYRRTDLETVITT